MSKLGLQALRDFERLLMVAGEHTWGWNGGDVRLKSWSNPELRRSLRNDEQFRTAVVGWIEQRSILRNAVAALPPGSPLALDVAAAFREIEGTAGEHSLVPDASVPASATTEQGSRAAPPGKSRAMVPPVEATDLSAVTRCGDMDVGFGADGSIIHLRRARGPGGSNDAPVLADAEHPLARVWYHGMDIDYFKRFVQEYVAGISRVWPDVTAAEALYKPGLNLKAVSSNATLVRIRTDITGDGVVLDLEFSREAHEQRGAPATAQAKLVCGSRSVAGSLAGDSSATAPPPPPLATISYTLRWFNKTATHAPETIWLSNKPLHLADLERLPASAGRGRVAMDKIGLAVQQLRHHFNSIFPCLSALCPPSLTLLGHDACWELRS